MKSLKELYKIGYGPSSSHTMGVAFATLEFLKRYPNFDNYKVILYGSLALAGKGHLTDKVIKDLFQNKKIEIVFNYNTVDLPHPNTIDFFAFKDNKERRLRIISIGGGSIKIEGEEDNEKDEIYPFNSFEEIKKYIMDNSLNLASFAFKFETSLKEYLLKVWNVMKGVINKGLEEEGFLPGPLKVNRKAKMLFNEKEVNKEFDEKRTISSYAYAVSEENASGGLIVTAPTCGACGVLPSVLYYAYKNKNLSDEKIVEALAVAGIIGNVVKTNASISGAEAGCQAEIGTACSMAAAAYSYLCDMDIEKIECAAEIALEHNLGLTCDPIQGYIQIPCIERNAVAALRAIDSSTLSYFLVGSRKISFDVVVKTMYETGKDINVFYRETSAGGLAKNYKVS